ncbi:MAG: VCBS repeat-containing protein [Nannocystaceae bacterium]
MHSPSPCSRSLRCHFVLAAPVAFALAACSAYDRQLENSSEFESELGSSSESSGDDSSSSSSAASSSDSGSDDSGGACESECSEGASECGDGGVVHCVDDDGDGCFAWGEATPCGDGELCDAGACVMPAAAGFSPPAVWAVPEGGTASGGFKSPLGVPEGVGDDFWVLMDIDGDAIQDLVVTGRAVTKQGYPWFPRTMGYPNAPYWEVYYGEGDGFAGKPQPWPVPSDGRKDHGLVTPEGDPLIVGDAFWSLRDLNGDQRPDLVITGRAKDNGGEWIGRAMGYPNTPYWEVYVNEGDGFAAAPTHWMLPPGGPDMSGFFAPAGDPGVLGDPKWETRDLDDDGYPDLVITGKALAENDDGLMVRALGSLETPYWEIYRGGPGGFAAAPEAWTIPMGGYKGLGFAVTESKPAAVGDDCWRLRDLNGDGLDDLIVTARATEILGDEWRGKVPGYPASPHWVVHYNKGDGFARTASMWGVPDGGLAGQGFTDVDREGLAVGDQTWTTRDIDGDGDLELVVTAQWDENQTLFCRGQVLGFADGAPRWDVFELGEGGFADEPWRLPVPDIGLQACGLRALAGQPVDEEDHAWITTRLDPDGYLDVVVTGVGVGDPVVPEVLGFEDAPHWQIFRGAP